MSLFSPGGGRDEVYFERDGARQGPFKCNFATPQVHLFYKELDIVEGDKLVRPVPGGSEHVFTVTEVGFSHGLSGIPPHYKLRLVKDAAIRPSHAAPVTNHITISGSTGIQIGNHNIQNLEVAMREVLSSIDNSGAPMDEREDAKNRLAAFLAHPLVVAAVGAGLPAALGLLS
ncbi:RIP homotypic interaction motif-containing protein [Ectopseudomonas khazarica]|uniref:RIP homotypic interaction motif-containing protein n=1 Tax=Ectopseudomonas khazarica TaxID=2502979 RepID=UPI00142E9276|nr:RIP homotypic interaction motif-containing protein [Pseudomonas khazarica]